MGGNLNDVLTTVLFSTNLNRYVHSLRKQYVDILSFKKSLVEEDLKKVLVRTYPLKLVKIGI